MCAEADAAVAGIERGVAARQGAVVDLLLKQVMSVE
jgi:hypothetical protein